MALYGLSPGALNPSVVMYTNLGGDDNYVYLEKCHVLGLKGTDYLEPLSVKSQNLCSNHYILLRKNRNFLIIIFLFPDNTLHVF